MALKITGSAAPTVTGSDAGTLYYDSTANKLRHYNGTAWADVNEGFKATGGIIDVYNSGGVDYRSHTFLSSGTFVVGPNALTNVDFLVIAGGGGGGSNYRAAGGGAGGYRCSVIGEQTGGGATNTAESNPGEDRLSLTANTVYPIVVGAGGKGVDDAIGVNGSDSSFATITSTGGGAGGASYFPADGSTRDGLTGGSGGGGGGRDEDLAGDGGAAVTSPATQGYAGGDGNPWETGNEFQGGGGGGGAGAVGYDHDAGSGTAGDGGVGLSSSIDGTATFRGGGGGGGNYTSGNVTVGGTGGGAPGSAGELQMNSWDTAPIIDPFSLTSAILVAGHADWTAWRTMFAEANTGGGGGGKGYAGSPGGYGGSGIVIIRYAI